MTIFMKLSIVPIYQEVYHVVRPASSMYKQVIAFLRMRWYFITLYIHIYIYIYIYIFMYTYLIYIYIYIILRQLTKEIAEMRCETEQTMKLEFKSHSGQNSYSYFKESFSGQYHIYQLIQLHSYDYLQKISVKLNMATDEDNSRNEM